MKLTGLYLNEALAPSRVNFIIDKVMKSRKPRPIAILDMLSRYGHKNDPTAFTQVQAEMTRRSAIARRAKTPKTPKSPKNRRNESTKSISAQDLPLLDYALPDPPE